MNEQWSLIVVEDEESLAKEAAAQVRDQFRVKPDSVLALPTGKTPLRMYAELVRMSQCGEVDFSQATVFNLDELYSVPSDHACSFASYLRSHFLDLVPVGRVVLLDGAAVSPEEECARIEEAIRQAGGLDLAILGIGRNGHIAFNEPGSHRYSRTRLVWLTEVSRYAGRSCFQAYDEVPYTALTMGVATILEARAILLLASGPDKAHILACSLDGSVAADIPASFLVEHPRLTVVADRYAAAATSSARD